MRQLEPPTGHVFRRDGIRRSSWYAKYRPFPTVARSRSASARPGQSAGAHPRLLHERTAEAWLRAVLDEARRGTLPGLVQTGATFADAAAEFLRYVEQDRAIKPSTPTRLPLDRLGPPRARLRRLRVEEVTPDKVEQWRATVTSADGSPLSNRTKNKLLVLLHGVFRRAQQAYGLPRNPVAGIERDPQRSSGDIQVFSVEEVHALVRAASSDQDPRRSVTPARTS